MKKYAILLLLLAPFARGGDSPPGPPRASSAAVVAADLDAFGHFQESRRASRRGDFAEEIRHLEAAQLLVGSEPVFAFELARAYSKAGQVDKALDWLEPAIASGEAWQVDSDPAFAQIRGSERFQALLPAILASREPIGNAEIFAKIPQKDLLPEGIAWDSVSGALFVSSTYRRKVVRIGPDATSSDFLRSAQDGLWGVVGMVVDPQRRLLWLAHGNVGPGMPMVEPDPASVGATGLSAYDLASGALRRRIVAGDPSDRRFWNALALRPSDGAIYFSDSLKGVFRLDPGADSPVQLLTTQGLTFPNGISLSEDEQRLYIAHLEGLLMLDLRTGATSPLLAPKGQPGVAGIDGLSQAGNSLIGVLPSMQRVVRWHLSQDGKQITSAEILLAHHSAMQRPTTGVVAGNSFFLVANAQLQSHNGDGTLFPMDKLNESAILRLQLGSPNVPSPKEPDPVRKSR